MTPLEKALENIKTAKTKQGVWNIVNGQKRRMLKLEAFLEKREPCDPVLIAEWHKHDRCLVFISKC